MIILIIALAIILCGIILIPIYKKLITSEKIFVDSSYHDNIVEPFKDYFFKSLDDKWHHTHDYIKVEALEDFAWIKQGELLLVDTSIEPIKGSIVLFRNLEGLYRLGQCISQGTLRWEPDLFDGNETPGIGYELIGVVRYHKNNILKEYKL